MVVVDCAGKVIEEDLAPSIDTITHHYIFNLRTDFFRDCHTHCKHVFVFSALKKQIPVVMTASAMFRGEVPVGDFCCIGSDKIGEEIVRKIGNKREIIMSTHGIFLIGKDGS